MKKTLAVCALVFLTFQTFAQMSRGMNYQSVIHNRANEMVVNAQVSMNAAGGNAAGVGGSVSYSVGQIVFSASEGLNGSVTQGVQQPYEISVLSVSENAGNINLSVYPNPATDYLCLTLSDEISDLSYQLFDMNGRLLKSGKIGENQTNVYMQGLVSAIYFVKVIQGNKTIKTYKIIKK